MLVLLQKLLMLMLMLMSLVQHWVALVLPRLE